MKDQLCYEVDVNQVTDETEPAKNMNIGLGFLYDNNEDRFLQSDDTGGGGKKNNPGLLNNFVTFEERHKTLVYVSLLGTYVIILTISLLINSLEPLKLYGVGNYALTSVKEVKVTSSFLSMSAEKRNCQNEERYEDCATEEYLKRVKEICSCIPENLMGQDDDGKVFE